MVETRDSVAETQRQTRVSVSGYITVSHVSVAAFSTEPEHFFTCFRQISVSESRISAIVNVCVCCGNALFRTGNLLFRSFYWRKREDTVRQPDLFFCVSVCFRLLRKYVQKVSYLPKPGFPMAIFLYSYIKLTFEYFSWLTYTCNEDLFII